MRTDRSKSDFERDGFVHIERFLDPGRLTELENRVERYKRETVPGLEPRLVFYEGEGENRTVKQLVDMQEKDEFFDRFLRSDRNQGLAEALLGEQAVPRTLEYFGKPPRIGTATPAHQDGYYFCLKPNHALTIWIALDDCDEENGCIHYVRGSHKGGILGHGGSDVIGFSQRLNETNWEPDRTARMIVSAGDCLVHHSGTVHFADANRSDRPRRAIGMVYFAAAAVRDEEAFGRYLAYLAEQRKTA